MKYLLLAFLLGAVIDVQGQNVSDNDIIKSIMGKSFFNLNKTLDSLGVWYHHNFHENKSVSGQETKAKIFSISNSNGVVKVYMIHLHPEKKHITEIVVNFRHDSRPHIEDLIKMAPANEYHVGTYSTDLTYKLKR